MARAIENYLAGLKSDDLLLQFTWDEWLAITPPYSDRNFTSADVTVRYQRNGYDWDMHGTLYTPAQETDPRRALVFFHGGAGSEKIMDLTPDGRPGLARVAAAQGFKVLALTYPGHYPPGGVWKIPIPERMPIYLLDRQLSQEEIVDRNLKCTFNVILQGAGALTDQHLAGREIIGFGHSTGGPMAAHLTRFSKKTKVIGLVGFGSGGPDGWRKEWRDQTGAEKYREIPLDHVSRRSPDSFKNSGYVDPEDLTPWGGADDYIRLVSPLRSQMKTSLCDNQHNAAIGILEKNTSTTYRSRMRIGCDRFASCWLPVKTTRATGSTAAHPWKTNARCLWAGSMPQPHAAPMWSSFHAMAMLVIPSFTTKKSPTFGYGPTSRDTSTINVAQKRSRSC
jgi:pimeloyl-ACP methyl ester carboxylesterase